MVRFLLMLMAFINTLGTVLGVVYLFRYIFYPYNYLLALAHKLYKGDSNFSTKGEFMSYAFKAKYGFISFAFILISSLIISLIGELNPDISLILLFILFLFFIVFGISVLLPLPKKLRSKTYLSACTGLNTGEDLIKGCKGIAGIVS